MEVLYGEVIRKNFIAKNIVAMDIEYEGEKKIQPGQFVNIKIKEFFLRRPISIADAEDDHFTIVFRIVGEGTEALSDYTKGDVVEYTCPTGRFFEIKEDEERVLLIGGGLGVPPLYLVAKRYRELGKTVTCALGFRNYNDVFYEDRFLDLGCQVYVATDDGSYGFKGSVIDMIDQRRLHLYGGLVYVVGPKQMLRDCQEKFDKGFISMEERMGCGMGACMGCVCKDKNDPDKYYRVCKEGPVFNIGQVEI